MENERAKPAETNREPVSDGDTRPDMQGQNPDARKRKREKNEKEFTENRAADVNSLEDYKDKKSE